MSICYGSEYWPFQDFRLCTVCCWYSMLLVQLQSHGFGVKYGMCISVFFSGGSVKDFHVVWKGLCILWVDYVTILC